MRRTDIQLHVERRIKINIVALPSSSVMYAYSCTSLLGRTVGKFWDVSTLCTSLEAMAEVVWCDGRLQNGNIRCTTTNQTLINAYYKIVQTHTVHIRSRKSMS